VENTLWYKKPAATWNEALPIGNGRLGAMVFGETKSERIQLNEDSCWSGGFRDRVNPKAKENLPKIRQLLREGKVTEAEDLSRYTLTGTPEYQRVYQTLGDVFLNFKGISSEVEAYHRRLCLDEALAITDFVSEGYRYRREVLASAPANVIAIRLSSSNPEGMSFDARILRHRFCENSGTVDSETVFVNNTNGMTVHALMTGQAIGGSLETIGEYIVFRKVKEAVLYITASTSFRSNDTMAECQKVLQAAKDKGYATIREEHIQEYQSYEKRVTLNLAKQTNTLPTDERLALVKQGESDPGLMALYFRYGRYLLISSSRPGSLPANLQGIWCDSFLPPWDSKYTININIQMNYWPAEVCNLSELHQPLFDHLRRMQPRGTKVAQQMYGARGFVAHHNTDIWGDCAPQDTYIPATYWVFSVAWFCLHIWEQYEYTQNKEFLEGHFDLLKDACLFFADFLIENQQGFLIASPTMSPENTFALLNGEKGTLCEGCAMDGQILWELFTAFESASVILGKDADFANQVKTMRDRLPPIEIGKNGGIMEWLTEQIEVEPGHRHMSHLFALFPGNQISAGTPLAEAAKRTMALRLAHGGGHTGWSRAWIINFWARLQDGKEAHNNLVELLRHSTLDNLFDDHPPFQIDGNFGATAAIAHMLIQSSRDKVQLLPALPDEWKDGSVTGLCAKGGLVLDFAWEDGRILEVKILAKNRYDGVLISNNTEYELKLDGNEVKTISLS